MGGNVRKKRIRGAGSVGKVEGRRMGGEERVCERGHDNKRRGKCLRKIGGKEGRGRV